MPPLSGQSVNEHAISTAVEDAPQAAVLPPEAEPVDRDLAELPKNDVGNAKRLIARAGRNILYVRNQGWHAWDDRRWAFEDGEARAATHAHATAQAMHREADSLNQSSGESTKQFDERVEKHHKWAVGAGNSNRVANMIKEARPYLLHGTEALDADPWLVNARNATLRLGADDVRHHAHRREDLISRVLVADYDADADAPAFRRFIERVLPDDAVRAFVQRFFGSCLTGDASDQAIMLLCGTGANGKSTLIEIVGHVLGDYALSLPFGALLSVGSGFGCCRRRSSSGARPSTISRQCRGTSRD